MQAQAPPAVRRDLDAAEVVRMQTSAGNQAVQRLLASRNPSRRRVDRLVGFEAEFSVPSVMPPPGARDAAFVNQAKVESPKGGPPSVAVEQFLRGGIAYGDHPSLGVMGTTSSSRPITTSWTTCTSSSSARST